MSRTAGSWVRRLAVAGALLASGCGAEAPAPWATLEAGREVAPWARLVSGDTAARPASPAPRLDPATRVTPAPPGATGAAPPEASAAPPAPAATARRPSIPPRVRTLAGALRRARIAGRIGEEEYRSGRRADAAARAALGRLTGARRAELAYVVATLDGLASQGTLISSRLPLAVLTVRRNTELFTKGAMPGPGKRVTFGRDPVVFQRWSGKGIYFHPLATAGKVNALAAPCLDPEGARPCRTRALRRAAKRLETLASDRAGYKAWEYLVHYGGGRAPWVSGMAQATTAQALARAGRALSEPRFTQLAVGSLGAFDQPPPAGIAVGADGGRHYLMYSFSPGLRILNGFLQSVIGLHDVAELTGSDRAERLYREGEVAARAAVAAYDTGAWSLYSHRGRESSLDYHQLVRGFLGGLCERARKRVYCGTERRFARYTREPPRLRLSRARPVRAGRATRVAFTLSKGATVTVRVASRRGTILSSRLSLSRGGHSLAWRPARRGRYTVRVEAVGPEGRRAIRTAAVRVKAVPKVKRARPKPKRRRPARLVGAVRAP